MDRETRNRIQRATQDARALLEREYTEQLEGTFDIRLDGNIPDGPGEHLDNRQRLIRSKLVAAVDHLGAGGRATDDAVAAYLREAAFTTLNRFVALKMLEARGLVQECVSRGEESSGFKEFTGLAPGLVQHPDHGYRLYIESLFDEIGREVRVLFDRHDSASLLWPRRQALLDLLGVLNAAELNPVWGEDETIGWAYQYFNSDDDRQRARYDDKGKPKAPQNSHELAVRNQFFTPRYVVQFLTDNTLARTWYEMRQGETRMHGLDYLVRRPNEVFLEEGEQPPADAGAGDEDLTQEELLQRPVHVPFRAKKDPRDIRVLDPACGSGHFLLYAFDLLLTIYEEAWADEASPASEATGHTLRDDYPDLESLRAVLPGLILRHNLHGVDIDPRCVQIAALALWMRAQRAYKALGISRDLRPAIQKTNIVVAEPMPGESDLRREFVAMLEPKLGRLVERVFDRMELAGEAGSLLRIEEDIRDAVREIYGEHGELFRVSDEERWLQAENDVLRALRSYAELATNGRVYRRRLFAEDAAMGLGFIDLCAQEYDVVLMNPPFGEPSTAVQRLPHLRAQALPDDLYCMFVARGVDLSSRGMVGTITSSSFLLYTDYEDYRTYLSSLGNVPVLVDLGWGILDAYVQTAMYVIDATESASDKCLFVDTVAAQKDGAPVEELLESLDLPSTHSFFHRLKAFSTLPGSPFCYWFPESFLSWVARARHVSDYLEDHGIGAGPHNFFFRLRWELSAVSRSISDGWPVLSNGGHFSPFYRENPLHILWENDGACVRAHLDFIYPYLGGNIGIKVQRTHVYGKPGLTYGKRTNRFQAQVLPGGAVPSFNGIGVYPADAADRWWLLGLLNSRFAAYFLNTTCGLHKNSVYIDRIPVPNFTDETRESISAAARTLYREARSANEITETGAIFVAPALLLAGSPERTLRESFTAWRQMDREREVRMWRLLHELEGHVVETLGLTNAVLQAIEADQGPLLPLDPGDRPVLEEDWVTNECALADPPQPFRPALVRDDSVGNTDLTKCCWGSDVSVKEAAAMLREMDYVDSDEFTHRVEELVSWSVGAGFGRFDARLTSDNQAPAGEADPFESLPPCSPGMLTGNDGLPVENPPPGYPLEFPRSGVLVEDMGHEHDLVAQARRVFLIAFGGEADTRWQEAAELLDPRRRNLRAWFAGSFFEGHITRYSKSRRKAPIYWQLATPSASYSVWLYYHRFTRDTLYRVLNDYVTPKLKHEERKLTSLTQDAGPNPSVGQRKEIEAQESFVAELRAFREEITRVAPLWNPNLNDGVTINFAPLWRLVPQNRKWQKECKKVWDKLVARDYDWAHLAMHLWPELVVPKCAKDRSLAIAHDLEEVFWEEDDDGKWQPKKVSRDVVDQLVEERTSAAVKSALEELLRAPAPAKASRRRRGRGRSRRSSKSRTTATSSTRASSSMAGSTVDNDTLEAVKQVIGTTGDGASKSDVVEATGISTSEWNAAISALLAEGVITKTGAARGTRYHLAEKEGSA